MKLELLKFGTTLISRELGREAFNAFQSTFKKLSDNENLEIDFDTRGDIL